MSLSVCCTTRDPGERVHAILSLLRPIADEIVVAADSRVGKDDLAGYAAVADRLLRFRHDGSERHLPWVHAQCAGDWIFRIDGDEVPSAALLEQLPKLTARRDVIQYWIPRRWLYPDREHWLADIPWSPDYLNRLVLNTGALTFRGELHTAAEPALPSRYIEAPLYHLDCIVSSRVERTAKAQRYAAARPASDVAGGGGIATYYLPERRTDHRLAPLSPDDLALVDHVLDRPSSDRKPPRGVAVVSDEEVERYWSRRQFMEADYRATIQPLETDRRMRVGECRPLFVAVRNDGTALWPWGLDQPPLVRVACRWYDSDGRLVVPEAPRSGFPAAVDPGETCVVPVTVTAPESPGDYVLELDLVHEFERWFGCEARIAMTVIDRVGPWTFAIEELLKEERRTPSIRRSIADRLSSRPARASIAYLGWLGYGNLGDEAMFEACRLALGDLGIAAVPHAELALRRKPDVQARAVILGGGTLIGHAEFREAIEHALESDPSLPLFMFAPGVDDPTFREHDRADLAAELERWGDLLRRFPRVVVRGERSRELLSDLGIESAVAGDPALLAAHEPTTPSNHELLGLNLGIAWRIWGNDPELLLDQIAEFGRSMIRQGRRLRFVPLWQPDVPYVREAVRRIGEKVEIIEPVSLDATLAAIAECGIFVGQKLHSVVLSSAMSIPSVMLEYHPKCAEFHASVGMEDFTLRTDTLLVEDLVDRVEELSERNDFYRHRLANYVGELRKRLLHEVDLIRADLMEAGYDGATVARLRP